MREQSPDLAIEDADELPAPGHRDAEQLLGCQPGLGSLVHTRALEGKRHIDVAITLGKPRIRHRIKCSAMGTKGVPRPQGLALLEACRRLRIPRRWGCPPQSPAPGFGKKYWSLSGFPSHSLESGGGAFLTVIFGQIFAYSAFSNSHFSSPGSVSGLIASTGHSSSHTPQSMHSSGWMTSMFSPS